MAFYLLIQPVFLEHLLSAWHSASTILNLQYNQTCKVICGKLLIRMSHRKRDFRGHQIQQRLFRDETVEVGTDLYYESSNVFGLLRLKR